MAAVDLREEAPARTVALAPVPEARSIHVVDFTGPAAVGALPEMVISRHGGVDGLISNAGITQPFVGIAELDHPARQRVLNANSLGQLPHGEGLPPHLLQRPEGHIADASSMGGFLPGRTSPARA